jgi:uncharacterized LabA/DUF88 family protein
MEHNQPSKARTVVYIDGFNLYHGLREASWKRYCWLDLNAMAQRVLSGCEQLTAVKYFTSRVRGAQPGDSPRMGAKRDAKRARQSIYLDALRSHCGIRPIEGRFNKRDKSCFDCGVMWIDFEEKKTDVNIALSLVLDAFDNHFDRAVLMSGDADLVPAVKEVKRRFPTKRVAVVHPPRRTSGELGATAGDVRFLTEQLLIDSQLPDQVAGANGTLLQKPPQWT